MLSADFVEECGTDYHPKRQWSDIRMNGNDSWLIRMLIVPLAQSRITT
jgi:hypothetical protein